MRPLKPCLPEVAIVRSGVLISPSYDDGDHGDEGVGRTGRAGREGRPHYRPLTGWRIVRTSNASRSRRCGPEQDRPYIWPEADGRFLSVPSSLKADYNTLV